MLILGINGSSNLVNENHLGIGEGNYHDSGAAILKNGELLAAFEEERLNRIKHTNKMPLRAIEACINTCGVTAGEVDHFAFSISEHALIELLAGDPGFSEHTPEAAREYIRKLLEARLQAAIPPEKVELFEHHYAHAVTAFYPSPFQNALVLTIDGSGGEYSGSVYDGNLNTLNLLQTFSTAQSLGHFYTAVTRLLGFSLFDEYKVMGLAPYGNAKTYQELFKAFYTLLPNGNYSLYQNRLDWLEQVYPKKSKSATFSQQQMDIAASLQQMLEKIVFHVVTHFKEVTQQTRLCISGGVALNCTLNGKLITSGLFEDVFVYPAANDSGLPVGSALAAWFKHSKNAHRTPLTSLYLGSSTGNDDVITAQLDPWENLLTYKRVDNPPLKAAELLANDKVIGWVQGRSEFAPRALGNRSILADSRPAKNKERINSIVKKREGFRPFAPSVPEEFADEYFDLPENNKRFPYMMFVLPVREQYRQQLGAITHVDGTARVQTVSKKDNPGYWQLINYFGEITGTPVILNTSFNNNAEPIVDSVTDAIVCFLTTHLDHLIVGPYLVTKTNFHPEAIGNLYYRLPAYITALSDSQPAELANTFNEKRTGISNAMYELLSRQYEKLTFNEVMLQLQVTEPEARQSLLNELVLLWEKRLVRLHPAPFVEMPFEQEQKVNAL